MTKTKLRIAAAMLAVLLLTCAWIGAVSAAGETVTFSYDTDNLVNIWPKPGVADSYWTTTSPGIAKIPVKIVAGNDNTVKQLSGYNAEVSMTGGESPGTIAPVNRITQWSDQVGLTNSKKIAYSAQTSLIDIASVQNIFDMNITKNTLEDRKTYTISLAGTPSVALSGAIGDVDSADDVISATVIRPGSFSLYAKAKAVLNSISFTGYQTGVSLTDASIPTITLYREHGSPVVSTVAVDNYDQAYDTLTWGKTEDSITDITDKTSVVPLTGKLALSSSDVSGKDQKTGHLTLQLTSDVSPKSVPVNVENWVQSSSFNTGTPTTYKTGDNWNFVEPIKYVYVVGAGDIVASSETPWTTNVAIPKVTHSGEKEWTFNKVITNSEGIVIDTYDIYNTKADGNSIGVTKNNIDDASKTVTITLTGYPLGDANTDTKVDIVDSAVVGIHVIKTGTGILKDDELIYADCNKAGGDGDITVADILAINRYLVELNPWTAPVIQ